MSFTNQHDCGIQSSQKLERIDISISKTEALRRFVLLKWLHEGRDFNHKGWYTSFYYMNDVIVWMLGTAFLRPAGAAMVESALKHT